MSRRRIKPAGLLRQSGLTSVAASLGLASGLLLDASIAYRFGAGRAADAYFVGVRLPLAAATIALVAANQSLVPTFTTWLRGADHERGRARAGAVVGITTAVTCGVALALAALAPLLVRAMAPGLDDASRDSATTVLRIAAATIPLAAASETVRAYLNAQYAFVAPALMNVVLNVVATAIILTVAGSVVVAAYALLAGGVARLLFLLVMGWRRGLRASFRSGRGDPELRAALHRTLRPLATGGLAPLARVGEILVLSFLPAGSISLANYGTRLIAGAGGTVFFRSIIVALLPRVTERHSDGDLDGVRRMTARGTLLMIAVSAALAAMTIALALPVARLAFERGSFTARDAGILALVVTVMALALPGDALQRALLTPAFARLDTRTPFRAALLGVGVNLALLPLLVLPFRDSVYGVLGASAAYVVAQWLQAWHAGFRLRRDTGSLHLRDHRAALSTLVMTAVAVAAAGAAVSHSWISEQSARPTVITAAVAVGTSALLVLLLGYALSWRLGLRGALRGGHPTPAPATSRTVVTP